MGDDRQKVIRNDAPFDGWHRGRIFTGTFIIDQRLEKKPPPLSSTMKVLGKKSPALLSTMSGRVAIPPRTGALIGGVLNQRESAIQAF
jgi:hypothetical protein